MENVNILVGAENFVTAPEAASMIGGSMTYLNTLVKKGKLKPARILPTNKKRLFRKSDVEEYIKTMSD